MAEEKADTKNPSTIEKSIEKLIEKLEIVCGQVTAAAQGLAESAKAPSEELAELQSQVSGLSKHNANLKRELSQKDNPRLEENPNTD